jgi:hypothetical protein
VFHCVINSSFASFGGGEAIGIAIGRTRGLSFVEESARRRVTRGGRQSPLELRGGGGRAYVKVKRFTLHSAGTMSVSFVEEAPRS